MSPAVISNSSITRLANVRPSFCLSVCLFEFVGLYGLLALTKKRVKTTIGVNIS